MKLQIILLLLFSTFVNAQNNSELENNSDFVFPVYPNCEKHIKDNEKLKSCFNENMWYDLNSLYDKSVYIKDYSDDQKTIVLFTIDKNGDLTNFGYTEGSNPELAKDYLKQIRNTILYNKKKRKYLIPAKFKGEPIDFNMSFSISLR